MSGIHLIMLGATTTTTAPASVSYQSTSTNPSLVTSHSQSNVGIGTAASNRYVYLLITTSYTFHTFQPTSVTVGGVSATHLFSAPANHPHRVHFFCANVTTGTTATVSYSTAFGVCTAFSVYAGYNLIAPTTVQTSAGSTDNTNPVSLNVNVSTNDIILGCGNTIDGTPAFSWTGLTLGANTTFIDGNGRTMGLTAASHKATSTQSPRTVSLNYGSGFSWASAGVIVIR
jgi:hypothetical protein